jgi:hypothetical protein
MSLHSFVPRLRSAAAAVALAAVSVLAAGTSPAAADPSVPADPSASGFIGLCDRQNHNISGGDIHDAPFVWKAVASRPPPKQFLGQGENTILNIYQPRPGVAPGDWSGDQLTSASFYATRKAPAAQATLKDLPLAVMVKDFPPMLHGLYELRMYFGKANYGLYSATYPATYIQIQGDRWSVVRGGSVNCAASTGESNEVLSGAIPPKVAYGGTPPKAAHGRPSSSPSRASTTPATSSRHAPDSQSGGGQTGGAQSGGSKSPVSNESSVGNSARRAASHATVSSSSIGWWIAAPAVVVAAALGIALWRARRRPTQ